MEISIPYVAQPGSVGNIFKRIKEAKVPDRFNIDFLSKVLGFTGGPHRQFIPLAKKLGFLGTDGVPTDLYKSFRSPNTLVSGGAMAVGIKRAYSDLYARNENTHNLAKDRLRGLIVEITGLEPKNSIVQKTAQTFEILKNYANFTADISAAENERKEKTNFDKDDSDGDVTGLKLGLTQ